MKEKTTFQTIRKIVSPPEGISAYEFRLVRPFYYLVIIMLVVVYYFSVSNQPELQSIGNLSVFTFLIVLHGVLHWRSFSLVARPGWDIYYIFVQSVIALIIVYMVKEIGLSFGVIAAMIGETFGIFRKKLVLAVLAIVFLIAGFYGVTQVSSLDNYSGFIYTSISIILFVIIYVELFSRQTEAREQTQGLLRELESAHQELMEYANRVEEMTLISERERMAFELHDTLGQGVAGLVLQLEAVKNHLENGRARRAEEIVTQAMGIARNTLADSRAVIDDLRQMKDGEVSLKEIIERLSKNFSKSNGIPVNVNINLESEEMGFSILVLEYLDRIISEVFFNIIRHAKAANVTVRVFGNKKDLSLEIEDDGIGFSPNIIGKDSRYGLMGIQERISRLGGKLEVDSQLNTGSIIKMVIPINQTDLKND